MGSSSGTSTLRRGDHAIQVFHTEVERVRLVEEVLDWIRDDEIFIFLSVLPMSEFLCQCRESLATRIERSISSGKMVIMNSHSFYCDGGEFSCEAMLERWNDLVSEHRSNGFNGIVVVGDLSWSSESKELFSKVMEYEVKVISDRLPQGMTAICQYDSRLYDDEEMERITSLHEIQMIDGGIRRNYWLITHHQ